MKKLILLVCLASSLLGASLHSTVFDNYMKEAAKRYWVDFPYWLNFKAQLYQESLLDPNAVSYVGASGLGQLMPNTKKEVYKKLGFDDSISVFVPYYNIMASAYYMRTLRNQWTSKRPIWDKQYLAQASYNAGLGHILKAQKKCDMAVLYDDIIKCLPQITGHHSKETITYVQRIKQWYGLLK